MFGAFVHPGMSEEIIACQLELKDGIICRASYMPERIVTEMPKKVSIEKLTGST